MLSKISRASTLGFAYCIGQSFFEAILGYCLSLFHATSNVNLEGALYYFFMRFIVTSVLYLLVFCLAFVRPIKILPSVVAFGLNLIILSVFLYGGLLQQSPYSFAIASIVTGISFILIDHKANLIRRELKIRMAAHNTAFAKMAVEVILELFLHLTKFCARRQWLLSIRHLGKALTVNCHYKNP